MSNFYELSLGAIRLPDGRTQFRVWAPLVEKIEVQIVSPAEQLFPMERDRHGYYQTVVDNIPQGAHYFYRLNGEKQRPDPASRLQPETVHGPSQVVDPKFA